MEDLEEIAELMAEPPFGFNHGRKKGLDGGWIPLETEGYDVPSFKHYLGGSLQHGTPKRYVGGCRCVECRQWKREDNRARRAK